MIDVRKSLAAGWSSARATIGRDARSRRLVRWLPVAAVLVVAGCSWFSDETAPAPEATTQSNAKQTAAVPQPGEGETVQSPGSDQQAAIPDINSVPMEAPKPSIVNLDQIQPGLGGDTANAQHTDETLTMPNEQAARPEAPAPENQPETAQANEPVPAVEPPAAPAPVAETPVAPAPAIPAPAETQTAALTGTPQSGSTPFEPAGPLYLTPGSLARNAGEAATVGTATAAASTPTALTGGTSIAQAPMTAPMTAPVPSGSSVSVDYSALGIGGGQPVAPMAPSPLMPSPGGSVAGVGQAVGFVYFGNGSNGLSDADRQVLRQVAELQHFQGGVLRIIGHASQRTGNLDAQRQDRINRKISMARATAVAQALVGLGVQPILVQVAAAGDDQTLYAESTPAGEAGNRRAEVFLSAN